MNDIYKYYSQLISAQVKQQGKAVLNYSTVKRLRAIRKDVIKLYVCFFHWCKKGKFIVLINKYWHKISNIFFLKKLETALFQP